MYRIIDKIISFILEEIKYNHDKVNYTLYQITLILILSIFLCILLFLVPYLKTENNVGSFTYENRDFSYEPIKPIPIDLKLNEKKVSLGEKLFQDPIISRDGNLACSNCHDIKSAGILPKSKEIETEINIPTVFNSSFNFRQFWDGRSQNLEEQISGQISENNLHWKIIIDRVKQNSNYNIEFKKIYNDGITVKNIKNSIAEFEESLLTPNSRFDKFLRGEQNQLTELEKKGYEKFKSLGCIHCHQGINIGGNMFQTFGVYGNYFKDKGKLDPYDYGLFNQTGEEKDKFKFKVPSLRNIAVTAPYLHDGSVKTLEEAIELMGKYQLGKKISKEEVFLILNFLKTLTGEYKGKSL